MRIKMLKGFKRNRGNQGVEIYSEGCEYEVDDRLGFDLCTPAAVRVIAKGDSSKPLETKTSLASEVASEIVKNHLGEDEITESE